MASKITKKKLPAYFKCPSCFICWENEVEEKEKEDLRSCRFMKTKKCDFCKKNLSSLELLHRRLDVLDRIPIANYPDVIKHLAKHVNLS